mgnify:CR=1 FL=1
MVYLPLPNATTREQVLRIHLEGDDSEVKPSEYKAAAQSAKGYSAADLQIIAREALMLPVRCRCEAGAVVCVGYTCRSVLVASTDSPSAHPQVLQASHHKAPG